MNLPAPTAQLGNTCWLPRIMAKACLHKSGQLPESYQRALFHPLGVDGQFLKFFSLSSEAILDICDQGDDAIEAWFLKLDQVDQQSISQWNDLALKLGKFGYPMHQILKKGLAGSYSHLAHLNPPTVFEALAADEADGIQP